ncbi:MAG: hypothetical protein WKF96_01655 [Solirubrobacteraceae bacterium]
MAATATIHGTEALSRTYEAFVSEFVVGRDDVLGVRVARDRASREASLVLHAARQLEGLPVEYRGLPVIVLIVEPSTLAI